MGSLRCGLCVKGATELWRRTGRMKGGRKGAAWHGLFIKTAVDRAVVWTSSASVIIDGRRQGQEDFHFGSRAARRSDVLISLSTYKHTKK